MARARRIAFGLLGVAALALGILCAAGMGLLGRHEGPGAIAGARLPEAAVAGRFAAERAGARALGAPAAKQILFGDLHVHTTFSLDAFFMSLPMLAGEGAHPPADACDFARYCSALDFWSINDHAEALSPEHWRETVASIRRCDAIAGPAEDPDVVPFLGWEWTQVGATPAEHFGHKNVVLRGIGTDEVPARPIAATGVASQALGGVGVVRRGALAILGRDARYRDFARFIAERRAASDCPAGVPERSLPTDCHEAVTTPQELFARLDDWGFDSLVIPHGTTWGFYTPPGSTWDKQLSDGMHDPERQRLIEVYSGHGNSEEYRDFRAVSFDAAGDARCPEPSPGYLPTCWRAGEIIRERCRSAGEAETECDRRAADARRDAAEAGLQAFLTVPGARAEEWLDAGQCSDCFQPAFNYRPGGAAQYILALRRVGGDGAPRRFDFGFLASSDNHSARPGTGYKEIHRREMTEATGARSPGAARVLLGRPAEPVPRSVARRATELPALPFRALEFERGASFFLTGGLVAVHARGRDRDAIWDALVRREVYGTSGPRILLWFDLVNDPASADGILPMGGSSRMSEAPEFRVRAAGSFEQRPGCPDFAEGGLSPARLEHLCRGECYHPGDRRRRITRIEVVRIRPQDRPDEPVAPLIEDPWRVIACPADPTGCAVAFSDPDFPTSGRDALYYVRAIEEPAPAVNAANLRCDRDASGRCVETHPCRGDYRTPYEDDCLAESEPRAWSSPVFLAFDRASPLVAP